MKLTRGEWLIVLFNAIYIIAFGIIYLSKGNLEFIWYLLVMIVIGIIILLTIRKSGISLLSLWLLSFWGLIHMMGGGIRIGGSSLYGYKIIEFFQGPGQFYILRMDQVIHFYGFFVAAFVIYEILNKRLKNPQKSKMIIFLAWIGAMGLGALNEVIEFTAFISFSKTGVGDLYNTGLDLIFNMFGALAGSFFGKLIKRKH